MTVFSLDLRGYKVRRVVFTGCRSGFAWRLYRCCASRGAYGGSEK